MKIFFDSSALCKYFIAEEGTPEVQQISGLPPSEELTILVLPSSGQHEWQEKMKQWMNDLREHHPFAGMSKDEILKHLRKTREEVINESDCRRISHTGNFNPAGIFRRREI